MDMKMIKVVGYACTSLGVITTVVGAWVDEKKIDDTIATKVAEAISKIKSES